MKIGLFQYNPETKSLNFVEVNLLKGGPNWIIVKRDGRKVKLECDYYIKYFIRTGDSTVLLLFERDGRLYPLRFSEFTPLEQRFLPPPVELEINKELYQNAEYVRLVEEIKRLTAEILTIAAKREKQKEFRTLQRSDEKKEEGKQMNESKNENKNMNKTKIREVVR